LAVEAAVVARSRGATMRFERELVELVAFEVPSLRDELRRKTLGHEVGVAVVHERAERITSRQQRRPHRYPGHALHAGRDRDVVRARDDALRGEMQRLLRRSTLPID